MVARGRRAGDSTGTRRSILDAAGSLFAEVGYERATLRAIAARAEVDPALIHHYFGSKEGLLAAVVIPPVDPAVVLAGVGSAAEPLGHEVVRRIVTFWTTEPALVTRIIALARTAMTSERAAAALRDQLTRTFVPAVTTLAAADRRDLRVALAMSQMSGLFLVRQVVGVQPLTTASIDDLVAAVGPTMHRYLTGDLTTADVTPSRSARRSARG